MLDIQKISSEKAQIQEASQKQGVRMCSAESQKSTNVADTLPEDSWAEDELVEMYSTVCEEDEKGNKITTVVDSQGNVVSKQTENYKNGVYCGTTVSQYTYNEDDTCLEKQCKYDENNEFSSMDYIIYKNGNISFRTAGIKAALVLNEKDSIYNMMINELTDYQLSLVAQCYPDLEDMVDAKFYDGWNIFGWETGIQKDSRQDEIIERIRKVAGEE